MAGEEEVVEATGQDMDYNITFPEPLSSAGWSTGPSEEPVVFLLGWAGCRDKHLAKYSSIYQQQGCITVRYTAALRDVFLSDPLGGERLRVVACQLLELLADYGVEGQPVLIHVFSNGGAMLYRRLAQEIVARGHTVQVVGAVFDSAPSDRHVRGLTRALNAILKTRANTAMRLLALLLYTIVVLFLKFFAIPLGLVKSTYKVLVRGRWRWPELYLYSQADSIVPWRDVCRIAEERRTTGVRVRCHDFVTSEHVSHFRAFPEEYTARCVAFLRECLPGDMAEEEDEEEASDGSTKAEDSDGRGEEAADPIDEGGARQRKGAVGLAKEERPSFP
ncbi:transmembrane protein 53 [Lethenteron reissneri]|uniref:transmembrane protein 53 n=1 Tax=Lethenteron reissneri TaxID=7753 RepID=UPI002AB7A96E|nr:transmembrane protein 53 [Lethenteron reissneri]